MIVQPKEATMKKILLIPLLLAAAFSFSCKPSTDQTTAQQLDKAQAETKDAAQQMKDYTFEQKAEFVASLQAQLAALNRDLDDLSARIAKSSDAIQAEAKPKLAALRDQATQLNKQLSEVTNATSSTWGTVKADSEKAWAALKDGFAQSRQWVSDKIAP
jgi:septal ring factor EnvC (AmiA/AmiB activator)